ncbi:MAG: ABC transporter permease [Anaerolineales bacterium]|nr:ABC transporter permease [Anaerolineales bacterium]
MANSDNDPINLGVFVAREHSPLWNMVRRLFRHKASVGGLVFLVLVIVVFIFVDTTVLSIITGKDPSPLIAPMRFDGANFAAVNAPPGARVQNSQGKEEYFIFGADYLGRDVLSRTLFGTRVSFSVAIVAAAVSLVIGLFYGAIAGYAGGRVDDVMMRIVDLIWGLPFIIIVILIQTYFKSLARHSGASETPLFTLLAGLFGLAAYIAGIFSVIKPLEENRKRILLSLFWAQMLLFMFYGILLIFGGNDLVLIFPAIFLLVCLVHLSLLAVLIIWMGKITNVSRSACVLIAVGEALFIIGALLFSKTVNLLGAILYVDNKLGGLLLLFIAIGLFNWIGLSRMARGQVLSYKEKEFVQAARSVGASDLRIIFKHLIPNIIGPLIVQETWVIPNYIFTEAFLSFIGLGVNPPTPSWGIMISESVQGLRSYPWQTLVPAIALTLTTLALNFLGDGLRDALDPHLKE